MLSTDPALVLAAYEDAHRRVPSWISTPDSDDDAQGWAEHDRWLQFHQQEQIHLYRQIAMTTYGSGLALNAGPTAWVQAVPVGDGWRVTGRLGRIGDETGRVLKQETLTLGFLDTSSPREATDSTGGGSTEGGPGDQAYRALTEFADDIEKYARHIDLFDTVPTLRIDNAGGAVPFQAEGTVQGLPFYFRFRSGHASLSMSEAGSDDPIGTPLYSASCSYGDDYAGSLDYEEFAVLLRHLLRKAARAKFAYQFTGVRQSDTDSYLKQKAGDSCSMWGHGHSRQEAWEDLHAHQPWMQVSAEDWADHIAQHGLTGEVVNEDTRVFPEPEPTFTVLPHEALDARAVVLLGEEASAVQTGV